MGEASGSLAELARFHERILCGLDELERLTREAVAPVTLLPAVRLELTRASRGRNALVERVIDRLMLNASGGDRIALSALREEIRNQVFASTGHISTWNMREIGERWSDYCTASRAMRDAMRRRVQHEKDLIYPLLQESSLAAKG